jgi:hypothetical protein
MAAVKNNDTVEVNVNKFTKEQLKKSKKYREYVDILSVVLKEDETYSNKDVEKLINDFMNKSKRKGDK